MLKCASTDHAAKRQKENVAGFEPNRLPRERTMKRTAVSLAALVSFLFLAADWPQFRGPKGSAVSTETGLPTTWSASENIIWQTKLPGHGTSSPVVVGKRVFLTCYSGYGFDESNPGDPSKL